MSDSKNTNSVIFIVYAYSSNHTRATKFIIGTYFQHSEAVQRQINYCGPLYEEGVNTVLQGNGWCTFINVLPFGDGKVELFTT